MSDTIIKRMFDVMKEMDGNPIAKEKKANMPYQTLSHDAVTSALRPLFIKFHILPVASVLEYTQDGNMTKALVEVLFFNTDDPAEKPISVRAFGYGVDPQDKGPGKAISYAVKYAYLKAFCLETTDDPENEQIPHKSAPRSVAKGQNPSHPAAKHPDPNYWSGEEKVSFGKYKGKKWSEVEGGYIDWILANSENVDFQRMAKLEKGRRAADAGANPKPDARTVLQTEIAREIKTRHIPNDRVAELATDAYVELYAKLSETVEQNEVDNLKKWLEALRSEPPNLDPEEDGAE